MKKFSFLLAATTVLLISSCSNDEQVFEASSDSTLKNEFIDYKGSNSETDSIPSTRSTPDQDKEIVDVLESMVILESSISSETYMAYCQDISYTYSLNDGQLDETQCENLLEPFTEDGILIRNQIISQLESSDNTTEDLEFFNSLSNEELAALSFIVCAINYDEATSDDYGMEITPRMDQGKIRNCLGVAIGFEEIRNLTVRGIINATTIRGAVLAIGKRYLGFAGLFLMAFDFYDCIK